MEKHLAAWHALNKIDGVQSFSYPESARLDVYQLFAAQPGRILDVGCSSGAVGATLKTNFPGAWVWGCELDVHAAQIAESRLDRINVNDPREWSAEDLSLLKSVDTILFLDVLEHMSNPWGLLQFFCNHISPETQLIISLPNVAYALVLKELANGFWNYASSGIFDVTHLRFFTLYEMQRMFYQTGFRIEEQVSLLSATANNVGDYPLFLEMGNIRITVQDEAHLQSLMTMQFGFRVRKASDSMLNSDEMNSRYGQHL
jgi:2-polyprenyl-3-methyl-5-hydroxy-6-metoxy-1,4-benzoquinol methylase